MAAQFVLSLASAILAVIGAILTWRAASIAVRDNVEEFINDLARQGRWYGAGACVIFAAAVTNLIALSMPVLMANQ